MVPRINKLLVAILLVSLVCYLFYLNPSTITLKLTPSWSFSAPGAVVMITTFLAGVIFCSFFAILFGLKAYWKENRLEDREKRRNKAEKILTEARAALASDDWDKARELWAAVVNRDPSSIVGRIELSRSLSGAGEIKEAIKVLDAARTADPTNPEVLFRAAELNLALKNSTAAIDNLALMLYHNPNIKAAKMARDLSEGLSRIDDALQYQSMLEKLSDPDSALEEHRLRLELKKIQSDHKEDQEKLKESLQKFTRKNPTFVPALYQLALMESELGHTEDAARLLVQASKHSGDSQYWQEAAKIWIKNGSPERAIACAKNGTNDAKGINKIKSQIELIKLYLKLNMVEEAKTEIDSFDTLLRKEAVSPDRATTRTILILKGRCFNALGQIQESSKIWEQLSDANFKLERKVIKLESAKRDMIPARLSTP